MRTHTIIVLHLILAGCSATRAPEAPAGPAIRVMTYNVNFGLPPDEAIDIIRRAKPDIICLQETTPNWEPVVRARLGRRYPHIQFRHDPAAGGMAILSRYPLTERFYDREKDAWFYGWAVVASDTPIGPVQLLNVHLRPPLSDRGSVSVGSYVASGDRHRREIDHLHAHLGPDIPAVVLGDFNENDNGGATQFLTDHGFIDSLREFDTKTQTWRWPTSIITLKGRYDHILYGPGLHSYSAQVLSAGPSDHLPVVAIIGAK